MSVQYKGVNYIAKSVNGYILVISKKPNDRNFRLLLSDSNIYWIEKKYITEYAYDMVNKLKKGDNINLLYIKERSEIYDHRICIAINDYNIIIRKEEDKSFLDCMWEYLSTTKIKED